MHLSDIEPVPEKPVDIQFGYLRSTFETQPERYHLLIEMMLSEFELARDKIFSSLLQKDEQTFRDTKHKLMPSLSYIQLTPFQELLEAIKTDLIENRETFSLERYEDILHYYLDALVEQTREELG